MQAILTASSCMQACRTPQGVSLRCMARGAFLAPTHLQGVARLSPTATIIMGQGRTQCRDPP